MDGTTATILIGFAGISALVLLIAFPGEALGLVGIVAVIVGLGHAVFGDEPGGRIMETIAIVGGFGLVGVAEIIRRLPPVPKRRGRREPEAQ